VIWPVGTVCEIRPAYSMDSGIRDNHDDLTWCEAVVVRGDDATGDVLVDVRGKGEAWVHHLRLKPVGGGDR
jgi:hypothetical protein